MIWHLFKPYFGCWTVDIVIMITDNIDLSTFILPIELEMRRREDEYRFTSK